MCDSFIDTRATLFYYTSGGMVDMMKPYNSYTMCDINMDNDNSCIWTIGLPGGIKST
jgi:hypothetical protein